MTSTDLQLEAHYKNVGARPQRKFEETITSFVRDIFWYNKDELSRQADRAEKIDNTKVTYEDHRKVVEIAVHVMNKSTQHDIAMCILTNRFFKDYRARAFAGEGDFYLDYGFLISKIAMLFNPTTSRIKKINLLSQLQSYDEPTLVQINHITGDVTEVTAPEGDITLNSWAIKLNESANESTSYRLVGLKVG